MNGRQDLGVQMGFGPIAPEADEPIFHAPWEKRALALTIAAGAMGHWSIDESRRARESLHPADYYASTYNEIWIKRLEALLLRHGFVIETEPSAGRALAPGAAPKRVLKAAHVPAAIARGGPTERDPGTSTPAFSPGERVQARNLLPRTHTRLQRYARGRVGASRWCKVPRLPRCARPRPGQGATVALRRRLRGARTLGSRRGPDCQRHDRRLGERP
jgi:nitrile hydratase